MIPENLITEIKHAHPGYSAHWVYIEHGLPTMVVSRYDTENHKGKKEKFFQQWCLDNRSWRKGVLSGLLPLYGLFTLYQQSPFDSLLIVEGEKCCSAIHQLGWPSVTNALGGSSVNSSDFSPLRIFRRFIILRDNDQTGIDFCKKMSAKIIQVVPDAEIHVCNLTPEQPKGDVIDWIQQYPLQGHDWNGLSALSKSQISCVQTGLFATINSNKILIQECPQVKFKPEHLFFTDEPQSLEDLLLPVPTFPIDCLAAPIKEYCQIRAVQTCLPPDFCATTFVGIIAGLIGRAFLLEMRPGHDWQEAANLWSLLIGNPASQKSPTLNAVSKLLLAPLDTKAKIEYEAALREYKAKKQTAKKAGLDFDDQEPMRRRFHTDDPTVASLKKLFSWNQQGILLRNDEASGQFKKFERDGNEGDRAFWLNCWSGKETYHEDRMTRESLLDLNLCLSWIGGIQPSTLKYYLAQATNTNAGGDGLMQRFQLVTYPDINQEFKDVDVVIPPGLQEKLNTMATDLDVLCNGSAVLHFDAEAQQAFVAWYIDHQNITRSHETEFWQSHLGKIPKLVGALCIQLHLVDKALKAISLEEISLSVLQRALQLTEYYIAHARRAYGSVESNTLSDARKILRMIKSNRLKSRFKAYDIYRNCSCTLRDPERVRAALEMLQEYNIVACEKQPFGIGRHGQDWIVHPSLQI
jgi:hypothetical protein